MSKAGYLPDRFGKERLDRVLGVGIGDAYDDLMYLSEVFQENDTGLDPLRVPWRAIQIRANYFNFRALRAETDRSILFPSSMTQRTLFFEYMNYIETKICRTGSYLIDVKYDSMHHFEHYHSGPFDRPQFLNYAIEYGFKAVHLVRRNLFLQYLSLQHAQQSGVWSSLDKVAFDAGRQIAIDVGHCENTLSSAEALTERVAHWIEPLDHVVVSYEDMFVDGQFTKRVQGGVAGLLGPMDREMAPRFSKIVKDPGRLVTNRDEVRRHFARTRFADMVEEALG